MTRDEIVEMAETMIARDSSLREAQREYERMARLDYTLPEPLNSWAWVRKIVSTAPYDALRGVTRALGNLDERLRIEPVSVLKAVKGGDDTSLEARAKANEWEQALKWQMGRASKRRAAFRSSVIYSAALYGEVVGQIIHLPTQFKASPVSDARKKAAFRFGDWAVRLVDPKSVHVYYSDYMPERVLAVSLRTGQEVIDFWGKSAKELKSYCGKDRGRLDDAYIEFDYTDLESRMVWVVRANTEDEASEIADFDVDTTFMILKPEPWLKDLEGNPVPFLPWVCVAGGTDIDTAPEHQRKPLLYPVWRAEQWATANILQTIKFSKGISKMSQVEEVFTGPASDHIDVDHESPVARVDLTPLQTFQSVQAQGLDPHIEQMVMSVESAISKATLAEVLVTGTPVGTGGTFSSYNLQLQTAIASLGDVKDIGQRFYEQAYEAMLLMTHYRGGQIVGYGKKSEKYVIDSEDIDPEGLYIGVELTADVPVDRQQRVLAAIQLANPQTGVPMSPRKLLEMLGETDPEGQIREWKMHQLDMADMRGRLQRIEATAGTVLEQMAAQMAQQMVQSQMEQQQQGPGRQAENPAAGPGIPGMEGQGFNPAAGGQPAAMSSPRGNTREFQMGETREGGELAGLG